MIRTGRMMMRLLYCALLLLFGGIAAFPGPARSASAESSHGIAMHGELAYPRGFDHFAYANPDAPKGGELHLSVVGSFDTLNPFTVTGVAAKGLSHVFQSLLARSLDEPFSLYGQIAKSVTVPDDRSWIEFTLNDRARFSDGEPITVEDVISTWRLLRDHGRPNHRSTYSLVSKAEKTGDHSVRFSFSEAAAREMPLIMGLMPVLPAHVYDEESFGKMGLASPVGSGPYLVDEVARGRSIKLRRDEDWWGAGLPVARGQYNFDTISYEYFRDGETEFEAFRKGLVDLRDESDPGHWETSYDFPAAQRGEIVREVFERGTPTGMSAFVYNMRRKPFDDIRVRQALAMLFPGAWVNRAYYRGLYERTDSFYEGSELSAEGRPADERETELLSPWIASLPEPILAGDLATGASNGSGRDRETLREALRLLKEAGFVLDGGELRHGETGEKLSFEILVATREHERLALAFSRALARAGVEARVRSVDSAQYQRRKQSFDFDVTHHFWFSTLSPGNEQRFYWGSAAADEQGSRNYMGAKSAAIDAAIDALLEAREKPDFVSAVRALDRLLVAGHYLVPLYHRPGQWVAYARRLAHPDTTPIYGYTLETWWQRRDEAQDTEAPR